MKPLAMLLLFMVLAGCENQGLSRAEVFELKARCVAQATRPYAGPAYGDTRIFIVYCIDDNYRFWDASGFPRVMKTPNSKCGGCNPELRK